MSPSQEQVGPGIVTAELDGRNERKRPEMIHFWHPTGITGSQGTRRAVHLRPWRRVPAAALAALAAALSPLVAAAPARAFDSYPSWLFQSSPHDQITKRAALAAGFTSSAVIKNLQYAVRQPDWTESQWLHWFTFGPNANYDQSHHCDRNPPATSAQSFLNTAAYIRTEKNAANAAATAGNQAAAVTAIGRGLHALQDCKAHSNFVNLLPIDQMQFNTALWDTTGTQQPPAALTLTGYDPNAADPEYPPGDPYSHGAHAKDNPKKNADAVQNYQAAFASAVAESTDFLNRVFIGLTAAQKNALLNTSVSNATIDALYTFEATSTCGVTGCTVAGGNTTLRVAPGTFVQPTDVSVLGVPENFFRGPDQTQTSDGGWTVLWTEIRPEDTSFESVSLSVAARRAKSLVAPLIRSKYPVNDRIRRPKVVQNGGSAALAAGASTPSATARRSPRRGD